MSDQILTEGRLILTEAEHAQHIAKISKWDADRLRNAMARCDAQELYCDQGIATCDAKIKECNALLEASFGPDTSLLFWSAQQNKADLIDQKANARRLRGICEQRLKAITAIGRNIDRLRKERGWSYDELEKHSGIYKRITLRHVNEGVIPEVRLLKTYSETFKVTVAELEAEAPTK